jgi:hypothetical protein
MNEIRSMADELRDSIKNKTETPKKKTGKPLVPDADILSQLKAYDTKDHQSMVHARFDTKTLKTLNHFKLATGIDNSKFVAFSVRYLLAHEPALRTIIKQFIQNLEL